MRAISVGVAVFFLFGAVAADPTVFRSALASSQPAADKLVIQAKFPRGGDFIAYAFDRLWMVSGNRLLQVNPVDNTLAEIKVDGLIGPNRGIAYGENAIWLPDISSKTIYKVDPLQSLVTLRIPAVLADSEGSIGVGAGSVWAVTTAGEGVTSKENHTLSRFNAQSGVLEADVHLPAQGAAVIFVDGSAWVTGVNKGELYRIDPTTNQIVASIALHKRPRFMTEGDGAIWVVSQGDGTVERVDPKRNAVIATVEADAAGGGGDIAFGEGHIWVVTLDRLFIKINASTNTVVGRYRVPPEEYAIGDAVRYGAGSLWSSGDNIFRMEPP